MVIEFRSRSSERVPVVVACPIEERRTEQGHKKQCDINLIIKKYEKSGVLSHVNSMPVITGAVPVESFLEAQEMLVRARQDFDALPSVIRKRFNNEPSELLRFVQDEANYEEGVKLGLFVPKPIPPIVERENPS